MTTNYEKEVVPQLGDACCISTKTTDHFCGNGSLLRRNLKSKCLKCEKIVPASDFKSFDNPPRVYRVRYCADCGETSGRVSSDASFFFLPSKDGTACGCGPSGCKPSPLGENAITASQLHSCTLVVEIVEECDRKCPTCFTDAPFVKRNAKLNLRSLEKIKSQCEAVFAKQGDIDVLQLSGGEPTLHPGLFEILDWATNETRIRTVLLNTHGGKLANKKYTEELAKHVPQGKFGVYLQYDGPDEVGQTELRAGDFRVSRLRALQNCRENGIRVALVMTVSHENKFNCAGALDVALADENIPWIVYQPEFISGRNDRNKILEVPINVADVIHSVALGGKLDLKSWMPLPCSEPNCGTVGFMVRIGGVWQSVSNLIDMTQFAPLISNRINFDVDDTLANCGCDEFTLSEYLTKFGIGRVDVKMVFIKPFMDARTWDEGRIAACCTHVLTPSGEVDSFCRYYANKVK